MMIRAYDEIYLDDAMENLGSAFEYAVLFCNIEGQEFFNLFAADSISEEFGRGNVKYISGISGIELAQLILKKSGKPIPDVNDLPYVDYPPEYWIGWIIAYYQWHTGRPFHIICRKIKYKFVENLYNVLHEADPDKAVEVFDEIMKRTGETNLAKLRKNRGLSQSQLAKATGISIRSVQMYEQKRTDIYNAQFNHLKAISRVLGCTVEDLLE